MQIEQLRINRVVTLDPGEHVVVRAAPSPAPAPEPPSPPPPSPSPPPAPGDELTQRFDSTYPAGWTLSSATPNRTAAQTEPIGAEKATSDTDFYIDPATGAHVQRDTDRRTDTPGYTGRRRHDYSRRNPFNADQTLELKMAEHGGWFIYDTETHAFVREAGPLGGACEACWHPTDPNLLWFQANNGGMQVKQLDVVTSDVSNLFNLAGTLPDEFGAVARCWTKGEGRPSDDGQTFSFILDTEDFGHKGIGMWLRDEARWAWTIRANTRPDHVSTSPLGTYTVASYGRAADYGDGNGAHFGVRAYPRDYDGSGGINGAGSVQVHKQGEHSDLGVDQAGTECFVYVDYDAGWIRYRPLAGGAPIDLLDVYPASGESVALHLCGICPGWVLVSTYLSYADYGDLAPAPTARAAYERVLWVALEPNPRILPICETYARRWPAPGSAGADDSRTYFTEPQATTGPRGNLVQFSSNDIGRSGEEPYVEAEDYNVCLPSTARAGMHDALLTRLRTELAGITARYGSAWPIGGDDAGRRVNMDRDDLHRMQQLRGLIARILRAR